MKAKTITINTFHKYMNIETVVPVDAYDIPEITEARCLVGEYNNEWYVWEYSTGMKVVGGYKSKKKAVDMAVNYMCLLDKVRIDAAVARWTKRNF